MILRERADSSNAHSVGAVPSLTLRNKPRDANPCRDARYDRIIERTGLHPMAIAWILLIAGLECEWSVDEVEIHIVELESVQTRCKSRRDALGPVIGIRQLRGQKEVFARDPSG